MHKTNGKRRYILYLTVEDEADDRCVCFVLSDNIGKIHFASIQAATSFATTFPHIFGADQKRNASIPALIPCAIDQDPYFRMTRDVAGRLRYPKPSLLHASFLPALQGPGSKMSASVDISAIFMHDAPAAIKKKINKYAFSGGQASAQEQRELGGNPDVDVAFQYLTFFLDDDAELERVRAAYRAGELLTGELKQRCIAELQAYVRAFQERKARVTPDVVREFMTPRRLEWGGNPNPVKKAPAATAEKAEKAGKAGKTGKTRKTGETDTTGTEGATSPATTSTTAPSAAATTATTTTVEEASSSGDKR